MDHYFPPQGIYSDKFLEGLSLEFGFTPDEQIIVKRELETSSDCWHDSNREQLPVEQAAELKKKLNKIFQLSDKLSAQIADAPKDTWEKLFGLTGAIQPHMVRSGVEEDGSFRFDLVTYAANDVNYERTASLEDLNGFLWALANASFHMEAGLGFQRHDPRNDFKLKNWIRGIYGVWEKKLNRKFTRDALNDGEPVSEAARFCVKTYHVLDPATPSSRILNEMKKHIKFVRHWELEAKRRNLK